MKNISVSPANPASLDMTVTLTSQYQLHIPKAMRELVGLMAHGKIQFHAEPGKLVITPVPDLDLRQFAGSVPNQPNISVENVRDYIDYGADYTEGGPD